MKPLATIGDAVLHGGPAWRADLRANGIARRPPPSSERLSQPDRGLIEQPGERDEPRPRPAPRSALDELLEEEQRERELPASVTSVCREPQPTEEREEEVPRAAARKKRVAHSEEVQRKAAERVLALNTRGASKKVADELGVHQSNVSNWVQKWGPAIRRESDKTLVSAPSSAPITRVVSKADAGAADQAAKNLVDMLGAYITAAIDARVEQRVNEAIAERMKRLL